MRALPLIAMIRKIERVGLAWAVGKKDGEAWGMVGNGKDLTVLRPAKTGAEGLHIALIAYLEGVKE